MRNLSTHSMAWTVALAALLLSVAFTSAGIAQAPTGNIFGTVTDTDGEALPGVTVSLSGIGADKDVITDEQGQFRFLALDPGAYTLAAELDGFGSIEYPGVDVRVARNTTVPLVLQSAVEETITVTSESPLLDERKLQQGTTITQVELEKIPTARDPWSVLNQTPGVLVDRVNVGGSESGQQSSFVGAGVSDDENDFMMDGVQVTDMSAIGASPGYYDFDQFAEMQFSTGGTDVTKNSSGVSVNLVTKRGTNEFRGSARFNLTEAGGYFGGALKQSQPDIDQFLDTDQDSLTGAQIRRIEDIGFEAGGALITDRLWLWGSWGQNDIQQNAASGTADDTILENSSIKANAQLGASNSAVASWNNGNKQKFGRGASTTRPDETTWNQRGPTAVYRFEDTHIVNSNLFVTGTYSIVDGGFQLGAKGGVGPTGPNVWRSIDNVWHDSYLSGFSSRPGDEFKADASYFVTTGSLNHELKVGGRFRNFQSRSEFSWPGNNTFTEHQDDGTAELGTMRSSESPSEQDYFSIWAQDTMTTGNLTVNVGFRYDLQEGENSPTNVRANPVVPDLMPAISFPGEKPDFEWETILPRLGATYALGEDRTTLLRASFAQFADQLETSDITHSNPTGDSYMYFSFDPATTNSGAWTGEPLTFLDASGIDRLNPTALSSPNMHDPGLDAPITSELLLGIEHAVVPEFVIGATVTARKVEDIMDQRFFVRDAAGNVRTERASDYILEDSANIPEAFRGGNGNIVGSLPDGTPFSVQAFQLAPGLSRTGGSLLTNGDRERDYLGATFNFTKRLANRWMARGYFNYGQTEWDVPGSYQANSDPNREGYVVNDTSRGVGADVDGELYLVRSSGSGKGERFLQSSWSANLNGMYQIAPSQPWGFNVSANLTAREGYPVPYVIRFSGGDGVNRRHLVTPDLDNSRLDDIVTTDIRLEKEFALNSAVNFTFGIDVFNLFNETTEMARQRQLNASSANNLQDNISPRIYRLGVRLGWK